MKMKNYLFCLLAMLLLNSCISVANMTSSKMDKIELNMSREQVTSILGGKYTIAEKRMENGHQIEVLSYRDFYHTDEFYLFRFTDGKLEKWYRELLPKYENKDK